MTELRPIQPGEEMVEVYDIQTDSMMLAPKALADRAELLKQAWLETVPADLRAFPSAVMGDGALFQAASDAAIELRAAMKPGHIPPENIGVVR